MAIAHGFSTILGVGSEVTLGTAVAASQKKCFISESFAENIQEVLDNSLCGTAVRGIGQPGTRVISGGLVYPMRVDLGDLFVRKFFGTFSTGVPVVGTNTFSLDNSIDGDGLTVAVDKQVSVYEWAGYKSSSLTISGSPSDGIRYAFEGFATTALSITSVLNTSVTLAALAEEGNLMLFQDATLRIGDLVDALQASDSVAVSEFSITIDRGLEAIEVNSHTRTEALENAFRESSLTISIPQYSSNFFVTAHRAHTVLQADIVITNGIGTKTILMPRMVVSEYTNPVGGPEFVTLDVTFQLLPDPAGTNTFITLNNTDTELEIREENT